MSESKLIFFTDDDRDDLELMEEISGSLGHRSKQFKSGFDLIEELHKPNLKPNILFLDLMMPQMDGFQVLRDIRLDKKFKNIPVVIHSASCDDKCVDKAFAMGANYFIPKSNTFQGLKASMASAIDKDWTTFRPQRESFLYHYLFLSVAVA